MHVLLWNVFDTFLNNVTSILVLYTSYYNSIKLLCKPHHLIKMTNFYSLQENAKDKKLSIHQLSE